MKVDFKFDIGASVKTPEGDGTIVLAAVDREGPRYLVQLGAGKTWAPESQVQAFAPKGVKRDGDAKAALLIGALLFLFALVAPGRAQHVNGTDGYVTAVSATNVTTSEVVFTGEATRQIRLLSVVAESESPTGELYLIGGKTPYGVTAVHSVTNLAVTSNAGVITNRLAIFQVGGTSIVATILFTNNLTNITLAGGAAALGMTPAAGGQLWQCDIFLEEMGVSKKTWTSESLFSPVRRGPLAVRVNPAIAASNRLAVTVKYDVLP